jgi:hypothetical protein
MQIEVMDSQLGKMRNSDITRDYALVERLAAEGKGANEIAEQIGITGHLAYIDDAFVVAFSKGYEKSGRPE